MEPSWKNYSVTAWLFGLAAVSFWLWSDFLLKPDWPALLYAFGDAVVGIPPTLLAEPSMLFGFAVAMAASLLGRSIMARLAPGPAPLSLCFFAGSASLGLLLVTLGSIGLYLPEIILPLVCALVLLGGMDLILSIRKGRGPGILVARLTGLEIIILALAALLALVTAMNPTLFYDAASYHLSLPSQYLMTGSTEPTAWHPYSFFPSAGELALGAAMSQGGPLGAQIYLAAVWIFALLMVRDAAARLAGESAGKAAFLAALAVPAFAVSALLVTIDVFALLGAVAALYCLCEAWRSAHSGEGRDAARWLLAWGLAAGGAAAHKYTAWLLVAALQAPIAACLAIRAGSRPGRTIALAIALGAFMVLPWTLRNLVAAGNPVMPIPAPGLFEGLPPPAWKALRADAHGVDLSISSLPSIAILPAAMTFASENELLTRWGVASFVGPLLWMGLWPALLLRRKAVPWPVWVYATLALYVSLALSSMTRFAFPALGALAVAAGIGLDGHFENLKSRHSAWRIFSAALLAAAGLLCAAYLARATANLSASYGYPRVKGNLSLYMEGRTRLRPQEAAIARFQLSANNILPPDAMVLLVGETRFLYLDRRAVAPSFLSPQPLTELLAGHAPEDVAQILKQAGITHVLISFPELERLSESYPVIKLTPRVRAGISGFVSGPCRPALEDRGQGLVLCELVD